jgi:hypothetical protein
MCRRVRKFPEKISSKVNTMSIVSAKVAFLKIKKNSEVNIPVPRVYFFFAGAFFTSFLAGFLAIKITSGFNVWRQFVFIIC